MPRIQKYYTRRNFLKSIPAQNQPKIDIFGASAHGLVKDSPNTYLASVFENDPVNKYIELLAHTNDVASAITALYQ